MRQGIAGQVDAASLFRRMQAEGLSGPSMSQPTEDQARVDEAIEGALRYMTEHPENRDEAPSWVHIEVLLRQLDRLRAARDTE